MFLLPPYSIVPSAAPTNLIVAHKDSSSVSLSWKPPPAETNNGQLTGYAVQIKDVHGLSQAFKQLDSTCTFVEIDELNPDTEYKFHVSAWTAAGSGPTATVSGRTAKGGKGGLYYGVLLHEILLSSNNYTESYTFSPIFGNMRTILENRIICSLSVMMGGLSLCIIKPGKLNLQFIVTARIDFQIFSDFRLYTATIWHFGPAPSSAAIKGRGLGGREFEPSVFRTLLLD